MSLEAMLWAMHLAPVPLDANGVPSSSCAFVLVALANHADPAGRHAFPAVGRLVTYTRLSERTVRTCLDRLEKAGIIRPCDPAIIAAYIKRGDRRPQGWDLAVGMIRDDLTADDLARIRRDTPMVAGFLPSSDGVQPLHPVGSNGVQPLHPVEGHGVQSVQPRGAMAAPKPTKEPNKQPPPPTPATSPADALAMVVVEHIPVTLAQATNHATITAACTALTAKGWTPVTLQRAVTDRPWTGTGPGALVSWLRGLGTPATTQPVTPVPRASCHHCGGPAPAGECPACATRPADPARVTAILAGVRRDTTEISAAIGIQHH